MSPASVAQVADQLESIQQLRRSLVGTEEEVRARQADGEREQQALLFDLEQERAANVDLQVRTSRELVALSLLYLFLYVCVCVCTRTCMCAGPS